MKSTNIYNLRASVEHGVWSSTKGANRVLQNAWENKKPEEKIIFIFSITHRYILSSMIENMFLTNGAVIDMVGNIVVWRKCQDRSILRGRSIFGPRDFKAMKG